MIPLGVGESRGVVPALHLPVETGIGPQMMAVSGHVQPPGSGRNTTRKQMLMAQRSVLSDHNSGKARLVRVEAR